MIRMKLRKLLLWLLDKTQQGAKEPFGGYFTTGIQLDGQAPIQFIWNTAFIKNLQQYGYSCETEAETVELFYIATRPTNLFNNDNTAIDSEDHPMLSKDGNIIKT